jgi:hypothetical protein
MPLSSAVSCRCPCVRTAKDSSTEGGEGAGIPADGTGAVVLAWASGPVDGAGSGGAPVDGTTGAEGAEVDMKSDTRLLELRLRRLYWWRIGGRGLKDRRRTGVAVAGVRAVRQQGGEEQAPGRPGENISQSQANRSFRIIEAGPLDK